MIEDDEIDWGPKEKYLSPPKDKNVDLTNADPVKQQAYTNAPDSIRFGQSGIAGNPSIEPVPLYNEVASEKVISNKRNAWIVLGTDRPSAAVTGYGGKGHTQCGAIDIVCGRMSAYVRERDDDGNLIRVNPDFKIDSARIYISQKADIDDYFELPDGKIGNSVAASAIALKADEIRVIARHGIKLITSTDARDSRGQRKFDISGIDLIAGPLSDAPEMGGNAELQPLVKGQNTVDAFLGLANQIHDLREILYSFLKYQQNFNQGALTHTHKSPFFGVTTSPSLDLMPVATKTVVQQVAQTEMSIVSHITNMSMWQNNYLLPAGESYICSDHNNTT